MVAYDFRHLVRVPPLRGAMRRLRRDRILPALLSARGKSHLAPVGGGKADDSGLTTEDLEIWHRFGLSTKEAREYHKQFNK